MRADRGTYVIRTILLSHTWSHEKSEGERERKKCRKNPLRSASWIAVIPESLHNRLPRGDKSDAAPECFFEVTQKLELVAV